MYTCLQVYRYILYIYIYIYIYIYYIYILYIYTYIYVLYTCCAVCDGLNTDYVAHRHTTTIIHTCFIFQTIVALAFNLNSSKRDITLTKHVHAIRGRRPYVKMEHFFLKKRDAFQVSFVEGKVHS